MSSLHASTSAGAGWRSQGHSPSAPAALTIGMATVAKIAHGLVPPPGQCRGELEKRLDDWWTPSLSQ
jgi:hypothetical protein